MAELRPFRTLSEDEVWKICVAAQNAMINEAEALGMSGLSGAGHNLYAGIQSMLKRHHKKAKLVHEGKLSPNWWMRDA